MAKHDTQDPVCKMFIEKNEDRKSNHEGRDFYFCSDDCKGEFDKDPVHYAGGAPKEKKKKEEGGDEHKHGKMFGSREKAIIMAVISAVFIYQGISYATSLGDQAEGLVLFFPVIAFALGVFCAIMPCCLPVIPGYVAILAKRGKEGMSASAVFIRFFAGLIGVILLIGLGFSALAAFVPIEKIGFLPQLLKLLAGVVVLAIGLDLLAGAYGKKLFGLMSLMPSINISEDTKKKAQKSLFWQGAIFGTASSPCALLIMTPIIVISISTGNAFLNFSNFLLYGIGRAVPYLMLTYMAEWKRDTIFSYMAHKGKKVDIILAILILLAAFGIWTELFFEDPLHHLFNFASPFHEHLGFWPKLKEVFLPWVN